MTAQPRLSPIEAFLGWHQEAPGDTLIEYLDAEGQIATLTVDRVYQKACALAASLVEHGKQDDVVGINLQLEPDLVVCFYACWLAGRTPTVFNLAWSNEVRNGIIKRLGINVVLYTVLRLESLPESIHSMSIEGQFSLTHATFDRQPEPYFGLINQSSGTTGLPKVRGLLWMSLAEF